MPVCIGDGGQATVSHLVDVLVQERCHSLADVLVGQLREHAGRDPGEIVEVEAGPHRLADQAAVRLRVGGLRAVRVRHQQPTRLPSPSSHGDLEGM